MWSQVGTNVDRLLLFSITSPIGYQFLKKKLKPIDYQFHYQNTTPGYQLTLLLCDKNHCLCIRVDFQILTLKNVNYIA
jgi:hypothetical protein